MAGTGLKAIETVWNGWKFRSRLEARWAIFFTRIGLAFEYEPEGVDLDGHWYLPDFRFPNGLHACPCDPARWQREDAAFEPWREVVWAEIKPTASPEIRDAESNLRALAGQSDQSTVLFVGEPWTNAYTAVQWRGGGDRITWCEPRQWGECPVCGSINLDRHGGWGGTAYSDWPLMSCGHCDVHDRSWATDTGLCRWHKGQWIVRDPYWRPWRGLRLTQAFVAARQARFEHGESPRV